MKIIKKINVVFLALLICLATIILPVQASTASQDGLEVSLTTDKSTYSKGENITASLKATNTNDVDIENIKLEIPVPDGYQVKEGMENMLSEEKLESSDDVLLKVTLVKKSSETNKENTNQSDTGKKSGGSGNTQASGNSNKSDNSNKSGNSNRSGNATTGDKNHVVRWIIMLIIAVVILILVMRGRGKKLFSILLGIVLFTSLINTDIKIVNAEEKKAETASITISETVKDDDTTLELNGFISYDKPNKDTPDNNNKEYSSAEKYYRENGEIKSIIDVENSDNIPTEKKAISILEERGFSDEPVYYDCTIEGEYIDETEAETSSDEKHPKYYTYYFSASDDLWKVYVINGEVFAYPVTYNLDSDRKAELIFSESKTLTSYSDEDNRYYVTVPNDSGAILETIDKIDTKTLDGLTTKEIDKL